LLRDKFGKQADYKDPLLSSESKAKRPYVHGVLFVSCLYVCMLLKLVIDVFIYLLFSHNLTTATSGRKWHWTGANADNNVAYLENVEVPEFIWRWFSTGVEIPKNYSYWAEGEPQKGFDEQYQTYVGCAAAKPYVYELKTFNCRTPLP
jgi:hypothetical protein